MSAAPFEHRSCPVCGSEDAVAEISSTTRAEDLTLDELRPCWINDLKDRTFFSYARCGGCGLLFAPTFFTQAQLTELYADMPANMEVATVPALQATQRGYWKIARREGGLEGGYLEIGPDVGYMVRHAAREGSFDHFWLFEPNRAAHGALNDACGERPRTVSTEMADLSRVPDQSIGLAVMVHVVDHLLDPLAMLRQIGAKLSPNGRLFIVTHNEASLLRRIMGPKFPPFCLQHPELYNPRSIVSVLTRAGFDRASVERSTNFFPIALLVRQAAWTVGLDLDRLPLPAAAVGLKLGNIVTIARR